ncbi:MAG: cyclase family protein [Candidatus Promineifilaceae bacterium]
MTTYIDISRTLFPGTAVWPGDTPFELRQMLKRSQGDSVNLTTLVTSAHTGTHVDAPHHFSDDSTGIDEMALRIYWGPAQVVTVAKTGGPLYPADFAAYDLRQAERILVRSSAEKREESEFPSEFIYPSPELADFLHEQGIILFGSDAPSMDAQDDDALPGHRALLRNGIAILEWLNLSETADGLYELSALPLKIAGGDGSPVRAALRK